MQYFKKGKGNPFVFGTELLIGHESTQEKPHTLMEEGTKTYNTAIVGSNLADARNTTKAVNDELNTPVVLRGLYKQGDTLMFANTLLKHAVITPLEVIDSDKKNMTIDIETPQTTVFKTVVKVCQHRIKTETTHMKDRKLIGIGVSIENEESIPKDKESDFEYIEIGTLNTDEHTLVNTVDFDAGKYSDFINTLNKNEETCAVIENVSLHNRGGKNKRQIKGKSKSKSKSRMKIKNKRKNKGTMKKCKNI